MERGEGVDQWKKLGLGLMAGALLLSFWAGLWYQGRRAETGVRLPLEAGQTREETEEAQETVVEQVQVHVVGAVEAPGVYKLDPGSRIADALDMAVPLPEAHLARLNLALPLQDGLQIQVPVFGEVLEADQGWMQSLAVGGGASSPQGKIDLNRAQAGELETLPGIGPAYARRIVEYRQAQGYFQKVEDLAEIPGIGPATIERLSPLVVCLP